MSSVVAVAATAIMLTSPAIAGAGEGEAATPTSPSGDPGQAQVLKAQPTPAELSLPASPISNLWAVVASPSSGPSSSIGGYSAGCLRGAAALPLRGRGFRVMRSERQRHFGHRVLIKFLEDLGRRTVASGAPPLAIGDLSMPRGGPAPNGHASHQSGLDADVAYSGATTANPMASLVDETRRTVNRGWNRRILAILRHAASDPRVARVFVHPAIKVAACTATSRWRAEHRAWLRTLRPWWGHDGHFHVRLACPAGNGECVAQPPLPEGDGCAELAWWFDPARAEERDKQRSDYRGRVRTSPELPKSCDDVLASK